MLAQGFTVTATDGSPEMAAEASRRLNCPVQTLLFEELDVVGCYDGVWASACLLHVPWRDLSAVLARVYRSLRPGGWFFGSYKAGEGEGRDRLGRYYNYPSEAALMAVYRGSANWRAVHVEQQSGSGYDGQPTDWLAVTAQA
jgi:SAM-dependent methyltransferase